MKDYDISDYESIIKKLEECKNNIRENWNKIAKFDLDIISEGWIGVDSSLFVEKVSYTEDNIDAMCNKIDKTINHFKECIKMMQKEQGEIDDANSSQN